MRERWVSQPTGPAELQTRDNSNRAGGSGSYSEDHIAKAMAGT